jgi:purine-binding chemotaxis protein CheW
MNESYVTFEIGPQTYALPLVAVHEVIRLPALLEVAGAPPQLAGMLNLRGTHLPVLDGHAILGQPSDYSLASQIVIVADEAARDERAFGLLVDQVSDVLPLGLRNATKLAGRGASFLKAVVATGDAPVTVIDAHALRALLSQEA